MDKVRKNPGFDATLEVWSRWRWLAILVFAGALTAVVSIVTFLPDIYQSSATLLVDRQQVPEAFVKPTVTSAVENRLQTITEEILSRSRLLSLIDRFGLYPDLKKRVPPEEVAERMRRDIELQLKSVDPKRQDRTTVAFAISYRGSDPEKVALVTNTLASFYVEENLKARQRQAAGTAQFLRTQLKEMKEKLDEAQLRLNSEKLVRASERQAALAKQLAEVDGSPTARIASLNQELTELRTRFSEKYPDVIRVRSEIAALEQQLAQAKSDTKGEKQEAAPASPYVLLLKQAISEADAEIKALRAEADSLRRSIATSQRRVENSPQREQDLQTLTRDYETTKELYRSLLVRYEEAQLAESMEQRQRAEQFRILDPATASRQPAAPNRVRLILIGLLLSAGLAAGAVVLAEQLDTSFHTVDDLRAFSKVPVLVSIPRIVTEGDISQRRWWFRLGAIAATVGLILIVGSSYLIASGNEQLSGLFAQSRILRK